MNKVLDMLLIIAAVGTFVFVTLGIYLVICGIKFFKENKSLTLRGVSIVQIIAGLYLALSMLLVWVDKKANFSFLGFGYRGPVNMIPLFILVVSIFVVAKDILVERMKIIKANIWKEELKNKLEQGYDKKHSCYICVDKTRYILEKYLSNIENLIFNRDVSYNVHCYNQKIINLDRKTLKQYNLEKMKKELDDLL